MGGRWKPTHNWYATHLFSDVFVVCGASVAGGGTVCLVKNDRFLPFAGSLTISVLDLASGAEAVVHAEPALSMPAGPGAPLFVALPEPGVDGARQVLRAYVRDAAGALVTDSFHPLLPPANWTGLPAAASVAAVVADAPNADGSIDVTLTTDATAAFVTMTTLAQGRFSDNAFFLSPPPAPPKTVAFYPWADDAVDTLRASLRVDHLAAAQAAARADAASIEAARARCARA